MSVQVPNTRHSRFCRWRMSTRQSATLRLVRDDQGGEEHVSRSKGDWTQVQSYAEDIPTQAEAVTIGTMLAEVPSPKPLPDLDYLQVFVLNHWQDRTAF